MKTVQVVLCAKCHLAPIWMENPACTSSHIKTETDCETCYSIQIAGPPFTLSLQQPYTCLILLNRMEFDWSETAAAQVRSDTVLQNHEKVLLKTDHFVLNMQINKHHYLVTKNGLSFTIIVWTCGCCSLLWKGFLSLWTWWSSFYEPEICTVIEGGCWM